MFFVYFHVFHSLHFFYVFFGGVICFRTKSGNCFETFILIISCVVKSWWSGSFLDFKSGLRCGYVLMCWSRMNRAI